MSDLVETGREMVSAEVPRALKERLDTEARRAAERLMISPKRARSVVIRLALAAYLDRMESGAVEQVAA